MELSPLKRREYYERALRAFQPGAEKPRFAYSCNLLWGYMINDYPEIKNIPAYSSTDLVRELLPEYYEVLRASLASINARDGKTLIGCWPVGDAGNIKRCEALTEAISRVNILITDKATLF